MRIVFMGTPDFASPRFAQFAPPATRSWPSTPSRRARPAGGMALRKSPVHEAAEQAGLAGVDARALESPEEQERFRTLDADAAVVVAYGLILPKAILEAAPRRLQHSRLASAALAGRRPIHRAIMAGDSETGDRSCASPRASTPAPFALPGRVDRPEMTAGELHDALAPAWRRTDGEALAALEEGRLLPSAKRGAATYAPKIDPRETRIDWSAAIARRA